MRKKIILKSPKDLKKIIQEEIKSLREKTIAQIEDVAYCNCGGSSYAFYDNTGSGLQGYGCENLCSMVISGAPLPDGIRAEQGGNKGDFTAGGSTGVSKIDKRRMFKSTHNLKPIKHINKR